MERALGRSSCTRTSAARRASTTCGRSPRRRSATRSNQEEFLERRASARGSRSRAVDARRRRATATSPRSTRPRSPTASALDIGGGSMQLTRVEGRQRADAALVAAGRGADDRALPGGEHASSPSSSRRCARTSPRSSRDAGVAARRGRDGGGWSASAARSATWRPPRSSPPSLPSFTVQGFRSAQGARRAGRALRELPAAERGEVPASSRGAPTSSSPAPSSIEAVMEDGGFDALEATEAGLREGVFFERCSPAATRRCSTTCAARSVLNLAAQYHPEFAHTEHVAAARAGDVGRRSPRPAATPATRASATCCGRRRCCTTSAWRSTTTTTTSTRAT